MTLARVDSFIHSSTAGTVLRARHTAINKTTLPSMQFTIWAGEDRRKKKKTQISKISHVPYEDK